MSLKLFEELTEAEIALRSLIYAVETKDKHNPNEPALLGEAYLSAKLAHAKEVAIKIGIPLVQVAK